MSSSARGSLGGILCKKTNEAVLGSRRGLCEDACPYPKEVQADPKHVSIVSSVLLPSNPNCIYFRMYTKMLQKSWFQRGPSVVPPFSENHAANVRHLTERSQEDTRTDSSFLSTACRFNTAHKSLSGIRTQGSQPCLRCLQADPTERLSPRLGLPGTESVDSSGHRDTPTTPVVGENKVKDKNQGALVHKSNYQHHTPGAAIFWFSWTKQGLAWSVSPSTSSPFSPCGAASSLAGCPVRTVPLLLHRFPEVAGGGDIPVTRYFPAGKAAACAGPAAAAAVFPALPGAGPQQPGLSSQASAAGPQQPGLSSRPSAAGPQQPGLSSRPSGALGSRPSAAGRQEPSAAGRQEPSAAGRQEPSAAGRQEPSAAGPQEPARVGERPGQAAAAAAAREPRPAGRQEPLAARTVHLPNRHLRAPRGAAHEANLPNSVTGYPRDPFNLKLKPQHLNMDPELEPLKGKQKDSDRRFLTYKPHESSRICYCQRVLATCICFITS
ncbi:uncharacterized protein LOC134547577 [Prinia subflava]|uniref:uncharacterized protein LOC134547577 n=1 Tax=Prinia subflava TaxID=208062 RepID=UPI002FE3C2A7